MRTNPFAETVELLVGPRFAITQEDAKDISNLIRSTLGSTVVIDRVPISGPIIRVSRVDYTRRVQPGIQSGANFLYHAWCLGCMEKSNRYKSKESPHLQGWANRHRCPPIDWTYVGPAKEMYDAKLKRSQENSD